MSKALPTIKVSGGDYAKVAERLKEFRQANPHGKHESAYEIIDGAVVFTVWLWRDKTELLDLMKTGVTDKEVLRSSADANGTAKSGGSKDKDFEKLESIALGRALANLGYLASGEIASSEEMERFENWQLDNLESAIKTIKKATKRDEFQAVMSSLNAEQQKQITPIIKARMTELKKEVQHAG